MISIRSWDITFILACIVAGTSSMKQNANHPKIIPLIYYDSMGNHPPSPFLFSHYANQVTQHHNNCLQLTMTSLLKQDCN